MTLDELNKLLQLLNMLRIKTKTDTLYYHVIEGIRLIEREIKLKEMKF